MSDERMHRLVVLGWRLVRLLPERAAYLLFSLIAQVTWLRQGQGVRRLEANLLRVQPGATAFRSKNLSRRAMHSYLRYWCDVFRLPGWDDDRIMSTCRGVDDAFVRATIASGRGVVLALAHQGNWDHAGAWAAGSIAPVTTVGERLRPEDLHHRFVEFRRALGIEVLPLTGGPDPFPSLVRAVREGRLVPLLADRDLKASGVPVTMFDDDLKLAPGPAVLALVTGAPLVPVSVHYERLPAGAPARWGTVVRFHPPVEPEPGLDRTAQVSSMSQRCADALAVGIRLHPEDWHMMQPVFTRDLTPALPDADPTRP